MLNMHDIGSLNQYQIRPYLKLDSQKSVIPMKTTSFQVVQEL